MNENARLHEYIRELHNTERESRIACLVAFFVGAMLGTIITVLVVL